MYNKGKYFDTEKLLDEVLKTEPQFELSDKFADVLAEKMGRKFAWQQYFNEFLIYLGAILGFIAVSVSIQFLWFDAEWEQWLQFIVQNISLILGINFLVVFILFADRVLLRYFLHRRDLI
ncbi:MAG TPA: hypothetical protein PLC80_06375 [Draconibacterium sp.]|nr:hypothetical protein [Draconibacterium sp.]